jgi:hypothetical protein
MLQRLSEMGTRAFFSRFRAYDREAKKSAEERRKTSAKKAKAPSAKEEKCEIESRFFLPLPKRT